MSIYSVNGPLWYVLLGYPSMMRAPRSVRRGFIGMHGCGLISILVGLLLASWPSSAGSTPVQWHFAGTVGSNSINEATTFSGAFTFDTATPDQRPDDPSRGLYEEVMLDFFITFGDVTALLEDFEPRDAILIGNGDTSDVFRAFIPDAVLVPLPDGFRTFFLQLFLPPTAFSSDQLPELPPALTESSFVTFEIGTGEFPSDRGMSGQLTELTVLPEPSSSSLVVLALAITLIFRRQTSRYS